MNEAFVCDYVRTPIGRYAGSLATIRADDLCAIPLAELLARHTKLPSDVIDEVVVGCANQAGEDNRNVGRMATLLAGYDARVPAQTVNRLCGSGMDAVISGARTIATGAADLIVAGGVESMSRAPFVLPKAEQAFGRSVEVYDTTIGWRFVNTRLAEMYGLDSMPETAENVAEKFGVSRADQDAFALRSQRKAAHASKRGRLQREIVPVEVPERKGAATIVDTDEHPRETDMARLAKLKAPFKDSGTVTAGNASGVNDGAAAVLLASEHAIKSYDLEPIARIVDGASAGVEPRYMGIGPVPATRKLLDRLNLTMDDFGAFEVNEAFASQVLATLRQLNVLDDDPRVNRNGGAIALGHPLGMSGARLVGSLALELQETGEARGLATMCVGVGQGVAIALERA